MPMVQLVIETFSMLISPAPTLAPSMPKEEAPVKLEIEQFSTWRCFPARYLMPLSVVQTPLIDMLRSVTTSFTPALTMTPLTLAARIPAKVPSPLIVIAFVMVTAPKPPGSSTEISPQGAVFDIAPAKVLHGAVRLHGLASSPTPDTHVLVACACATDEIARLKTAIAKILNAKRNFLIMHSPFELNVILFIA